MGLLVLIKKGRLKYLRLVHPVSGFTTPKQSMDKTLSMHIILLHVYHTITSDLTAWKSTNYHMQWLMVEITFSCKLINQNVNAGYN